MVNISHNNTEYPVSNNGINQENLRTTIDKSKQVAADNFENSSTTKVVSGNITNPDTLRKTAIVVAPLYLIDKFVNKLMSGEDKNLLKSIANAGDKIYSALHIDKLKLADKGKRVSDWIKQNRFTKYFTNDYKANQILCKSQTISENYTKQLTSALEGIKKSSEYSNIYSSLTAQQKKFFDSLGSLKMPYNENNIALFIEELKKVPNNDQSVSKIINNINKITNNKLYQKLDSCPSKLAKELTKWMNSSNTSAETKKLIKDFLSNKTTYTQEEILDIAKNLKQNGIDFRDSSLLINECTAAASKMGKTGLGNAFSKGFLKTKDLLTYGGGLISLAFAANTIIQAVSAAKEAPKGEKKSTFMHVLSEGYMGMLLYAPSMNLLYKIGGNKYRGMSVEAKQTLGNIVKTTTDLAKQGNLDKNAYKIAQLQKKWLLKGVPKNMVDSLSNKTIDEAKNIIKNQNFKQHTAKLKFWEKPLKAFGSILDTGLDTIKKPTKLGRASQKLKGFAGGFARFALIMFVLQPLVQKPVTKLVHKIFGEPKTYLEKQSAKNAQDQSKNNSTKYPNNDPNETNLIKLWTTPSQQDESNIPNTNPNTNEEPTVAEQTEEDNTSIPARRLKDNNKNSDRYIPSIIVQHNDKELKEREKVAEQLRKEIQKDINDAKKFLKN